MLRFKNTETRLSGEIGISIRKNNYDFINLKNNKNSNSNYFRSQQT